MWLLFQRKGPSGFSGYSTAEDVTNGIDGSGLTAIVTGASSGIGLETARVLSLRGVNVVLGVRNMAAGEQAKEAITKEIPSAKVDAMELDLSSLASVRKFAAEFISWGRSLNILINNAGIAVAPFMMSEDGIELQFATNHLGHFLLTNLLLEVMRKSAGEMRTEGRIVNVSSEGYRLAYGEGIRFEKLSDGEGYNRWSAYGQSKLANILHARELARRLKEEGSDITSNSVHPGTIGTNIFRHLGVFEGVVLALGKLIFKTVQQGASTTCYVALNPQVKGVSGEYFLDNNLAGLSSQAANSDMARKLWDFSMELTN